MFQRVRAVGRWLYAVWGVLIALGLVIALASGRWQVPAIFLGILVVGALLIALEHRVYGPQEPPPDGP
jgi:hypothetical protein